LEVLGVFGLSILFWSRWKMAARLAIGYLALMCFAGIAITGSRGGYLSTAIALLVFTTLSLISVYRLAPYQFGKLLFAIVVAVGAAVVATLTVIYNSPFLVDRFHNILQYKDVRVLIWNSAWKAFHLNPWEGTGAGMFLYWGRHFREMSVQNDPIFVHNDYLHLLSEYGIIGAIFMFLMLLAHLVHGARWFQKMTKLELAPRGESSSNRLALQIGALSAIAAYLGHSVVDFNLHIPANALLMAFIFGIIANPGREAESSELDESRPRFLPLAALSVPALSLLLAFESLPKLAGEYYAELARMSLRDNQFSETVRYADAALLVETRNPNIYYYMGEAKRVLSEESEDLEKRITLQFEAENSFKQGLALFPHHLDMLLRMGRLYDSMHRYADAQKMYLLSMDADPNLGAVYAFYGLHFHVQGQFKEAREQYDHAMRLAFNPIAAEGLKEIDEIEQKQKEHPQQRPKSVREQLMEMEQQLAQPSAPVLPVVPAAPSSATPSPTPSDAGGY